MPSYRSLLPGDPAAWFHARSTSRQDFAFDTIAGRYLVLCFFTSAGDARGRAAVDAALAQNDANSSFLEDGGDARALETYLGGLARPQSFAGFEVPAPIRSLVSPYERHGGTESGFMEEVDGKTVLRQGHDHKRRRDYEIMDPVAMNQARQRIARRVAPEILKVHQFNATRMERYDYEGCSTRCRA
jgi:hypothetical protein